MQRRWFIATAAAAVAGLGASAPAAAADSATLVPVSGTVSGAPESVAFAGNAQVRSRLAKDPDFNAPSLIVTIDLSGVSGTGSMTGRKYAISGPHIVQRRLAASHTVDVSFPFADASGPPRSGLASFVLGFDTSSGAVTAASGALATPNF